MGWARAVTSDAYLLWLCRTIHANPLRHGMADTPEGWPYSNLQEWLGLRPGSLLDRDFVETYFPNSERVR